MSYATQSDITDRHGQDILPVVDRDGDDIIDVVAVEKALADASAEIDSYLIGDAPGNVIQLCVDITVHRLALSADIATDEYRARYTDAIAQLKYNNPKTSASASIGHQDVMVDSETQQFTRTKMQNVL